MLRRSGPRAIGYTVVHAASVGTGRTNFDRTSRIFPALPAALILKELTCRCLQSTSPNFTQLPAFSLLNYTKITPRVATPNARYLTRRVDFFASVQIICD
jgi:hypothetical protein